MKVDHLKAFLGEPFQGAGPEHRKVVKNWEAFIGRHTGIFAYDAKSNHLSLGGAQGIAVQAQTESQVVQHRTAMLRNEPVQAVSCLKYT